VALEDPPVVPVLPLEPLLVVPPVASGSPHTPLLHAPLAHSVSSVQESPAGFPVDDSAPQA
jgi:hypothetical protein